MVQPDLAEVLTRVQTRRTSFRSITADARVVTGEEYERLLQEREDRARVAAEQRATRARGAEGRPCQGGGGAEGAESRPCQGGGGAEGAEGRRQEGKSPRQGLREHPQLPQATHLL